MRILDSEFLWGVFLSYLIGSAPTAYIVSKIVSGIDIRKHGSGNVGATNVLRVLGKRWAGLVLLVDIVKGVLVVGMLPLLFGVPSSVCFLSLVSLGCVAGHNWPIFLRFKGGKGVATTLGVILGLGSYEPRFFLILLLCLGMWVLFFLLFKIVSLSSLAAGVSLPLFTFFLCKDFILLSLILFILLFLRHSSNIKRMLAGKEKPIKFNQPS